MTLLTTATRAQVSGQLGSVTVDPAGPTLTNYTSLGEWNTNGNFDGWTTVQVSNTVISGGLLTSTASGHEPQLILSVPGIPPDLDLAFNDYIDVRLQVPAGFTGAIPIYYGTTFTPEIDTTTSRVLTIPNSAIPSDGAFHVYRIFIGPQVYWRSSLTDVQLDPLGTNASAGQTFAVDYIRLGDLPADVYYPRYSVNCPGPGTNDTANNLPVTDMSSKHFRVIWDSAVTGSSFWRANMPHGTLRNLEEVWKSHVWYLGYREPSQSWIPANRDGKKYKVNLTMFYGGYFSGGDNGGFGWINITPDGLQVDPPTWVPPHEFTHVLQMHQEDGGQNMLGDWWESHANYCRERWLYYYPWYPNTSGLDPFFADTAHFYCSHGRHYYLCWPLYLYLDENPDNLPDLGPGFVVKLWQNVQPGEYIYSTIQRFATNTPLQDLIGYYARRNVVWDYSHRSALTNAANTGDQDLAQRWTVAELRQRPDDPTWWQVPPEMAPMQGAYKIHQLIPQGSGAGRVVSVNFHGLPIASRGADWRASFVVVSDSGAVRYSTLWNAGTNSVILAANENTLYLVVAATPQPPFLYGSFDDTVYPYQLSNPANPSQSLSQQRTRFPYEIQVLGATPKESNNGGTAGLVPVSNGGGWRSSTAVVDATAYVGPNARVLGTAQVRNQARIEDYAVVKDGAQVLGDAVVSGHALVRNTAVVKENAKVRDYAMIIDNSVVGGYARILQHGEITAGSIVSNWATIKGCASTWHDSSVTTNAQAWNDAVLDGDFSTAQSVRNGFQFGFLPYNPGPLNWISNRTAPRRLFADYEFTQAHDSLAKDFYGVTDGYLVGNPAWVATDGQRSGFLTFDGASQYVLLDRSVSDLPEITIAAWIRWAGGAPNQPAWWFGAATNQCLYFTPDDGAGHARFVIRNGGPDQGLFAPAALATGVWTHVAVTLSNGIVGRLYVNGMLQQQGAITITPDQLSAPNVNTAAQYNYLARGGDLSQPLFNGALDSVRIYTGPLTDAELAGVVPNHAPVLAPIANRTTGAGVPVTFTNLASDPDLPWQTLTFGLMSAPAGATLDPQSGAFYWRPAVAQANSTNFLIVRVSDNGNPNLSAYQSAFFTVNPLNPPTLGSVSLANGHFQLSASGDPGPDYMIQSSTNLVDWSLVFSTNSPSLPFTWTDPDANPWAARFYRVVLGP